MMGARPIMLDLGLLPLPSKIATLPLCVTTATFNIESLLKALTAAVIGDELHDDNILILTKKGLH